MAAQELLGRKGSQKLNAGQPAGCVDAVTSIIYSRLAVLGMCRSGGQWPQREQVHAQLAAGVAADEHRSVAPQPVGRQCCDGC